MRNENEKFMMAALNEAKAAGQIGEVPIGAVVVKNGNIIGRGHNLTITKGDPRAHAEMVAMDDAYANNNGFRLLECSMYVTVEPCAMCAGALVLSRIEKVYIGAMDPKAGACGSVCNILGQTKLNHNVEIIPGVLERECADIIKNFFKEIRKSRRKEK